MINKCLVNGAGGGKSTGLDIIMDGIFLKQSSKRLNPGGELAAINNCATTNDVTNYEALNHFQYFTAVTEITVTL